MRGMVSLPVPADIEQFRRLRADPSRWLPIALDIAGSHGYGGREAAVFTTGTNLVVGIGERLILKIFPPMHRSQFVSERGALLTLAGRLRIAIPELVHEGGRDGWPYLIITRLSGVLASNAWPNMAEADRELVLRQLGETIAGVQHVPPGELLRIEPDWASFMERQIEGCHARHRRLGLADKFLDGLDELLRDARDLIPTDAPPVILTGEYIPENFLLARDHDGWRVCGLFDFGDVLTGWGEYDLLGPSAFMAAGRPGRVRSLFEGYGYRKVDIDGRLKRRLLALMLLHRASDLNRHICIDDWSSQAENLADLQELIWPG
jgi:hygromycin-B 7''-O-kinase